MTDKTIAGGCLCGKVRYKVGGKLGDVIACHCRECRRMSGHFFAAIAAEQGAFEITESTGLAWYNSSKTSRRGFCRECGSSLFFDHGPLEPMGIAAGSIDGDTGLNLVAHIYVDESGDYYSIADGVKAYTSEAWRDGGWIGLRHE